MSTRRQRIRREARRAETRAPALIEREPTPGRDTFRAAAARREASVALPNLLTQQPAPTGRRAVAEPAARATSEGIERERPKKQPRARDETALSLDARRCKSRPDSREKGDGAGRPFVPWCK